MRIVLPLLPNFFSASNLKLVLPLTTISCKCLLRISYSGNLVVQVFSNILWRFILREILVSFLICKILVAFASCYSVIPANLWRSSIESGICISFPNVSPSFVLLFGWCPWIITLIGVKLDNRLEVSVVPAEWWHIDRNEGCNMF